MSKRKQQPEPPDERGYQPGTLAWYFSHLAGGETTAIQLLVEARLQMPDDHPLLFKTIEFLNRWREIKHPGPKTLDWLCTQVGFSPRDFWTLTMSTLYDHKDAALDMLRTVMEPAVLGRSIDEALRPGGFKDRTALLKQWGHHHAPQPSQINLNQQNVTINEDRGLPDFDETVHTLHRVLTEPAQLAAALVAVEITAKETVTDGVE